MKTLQELYTEIMGSNELKKAFAEAAKDGKLEDFLKANGCEGTEADVTAFLQGKANQELSDEELDNAAGGGCSKETQNRAIFSVCTTGIGCFLGAIGSVMGWEEYICWTE